MNKSLITILLGGLVYLLGSAVSGQASHRYHGGYGFRTGYGGVRYIPSRIHSHSHSHSHFRSYPRRYYYRGYGHRHHYGTGYGSRYGYGNFYVSPPVPYASPRIYVYPQPVRVGATRGPIVRNVLVRSNPDLDLGESQPEDGKLAALTEPPQATRPEVAWVYLAEGKFQEALGVFAYWAGTEPDHGLYKAGYGLSAALNGDRITANYALRHAFATDPEAASMVPLTGELKTRIAELAAQYREQLAKEPEDLNLRFLYAATSHFNHQDATARTCLEGSLSQGDDTRSVAQLQSMIQKRLTPLSSPD